jgi:acyl-[acyl-carrier-protein]-phospholipid O-acyltransferase/long-chain-fatty-acid--[acyl-carrier-protein] ligase
MSRKKNLFTVFMLFFHKKKDPFFSKQALHFLNGAQFLGVINDNIFKLLIVFLFIDLKGVDHASSILFWVGTIYVLPFLLFSPVAGILADKFSKQRIIIFLKASEVVLMFLGIFAFLCKNDWASYSLLFLLSLQSALFSPPKYSVIPELVSSEDKISRANGLITSFTYLGIIFGTFLASFLTQITNRNFPLTACICTLIALGGFFFSLFLPQTKPKGTETKIPPFFLREIYRNLKYATSIPYLFIAILGASSFLFIGAYFQLNIIPFAIESLHMSEVGGGYLFLITAIGIASGAFLAGRLSKNRIEIGLACLSGALLSLSLFILSILPQHLPTIFSFLFVIGLFGGLFIVPFDAYIQTYSPEKKRGQIIAASNFLSFCGVLIAPMLLYLFSGILDLTAARGFTLSSLLIFLMVFFIITRFSGYFFQFICHSFVKLLYKTKIEKLPTKRGIPVILVIEKIETLPLLLLLAIDPRLHLYIPKKRKQLRDPWLKLFASIDFLYVEDFKERLLRSFVKILQGEIGKEETPCLLFPNSSFLQEKSSKKLIQHLQKTTLFHFKSVHIRKIARKERGDRLLFKKPELIIEFQ